MSEESTEPMKDTKTGRGFELVEFIDRYGAACSLQQSSAADYIIPGSSFLWLGRDKNAEPHPVTKEELPPRMHLNRDQVQELVTRMQTWLLTGSIRLSRKTLEEQFDDIERRRLVPENKNSQEEKS